MELKIKIDKASVNAFVSEISKVVEKTVTEALKKTNHENVREDDKLLTRNEVMEMLKISHSTLYHHQIKGYYPLQKNCQQSIFQKRRYYR